MATLLQLKRDFWQIGDLESLSAWMPGTIKRVFYIYGAGEEQRAGHGHHHTHHALVCLQGSCRVQVANQKQETEFWLHNPLQCLILHPEDWRTMDNFSQDAILVILSNQTYDPSDYFYEKPRLIYRSAESFRQLTLN